VHICGMASRDHWVEGLLCPVCGKIGLADLSQMDGSFEIQVDSVAEGFTVFESMHGIIFYCSSCNVPVEP
jgi:hypothetical protein